MGTGGPAVNPFDIFDSFFGGGAGHPFEDFFGVSSRSSRRKRRGEDVVHPLKVSLEDVYNGTCKKLSLSRNILCPRCKGKGSKTSASGRCVGCQGQGMRVTIRHLGPGMIQQMQHICPDCKGSGESLIERDKCSQCRGSKVVQDKKILEVHVEKGMKHGQKIVFTGEADQAPNTETGDIIFVLQLKEHFKFKRKGDDLFIDHTLRLVEALCGFRFALTHLDGRQLLIKTNPGEVIKPGQTKCINHEGMPLYQRPFIKGNLYVHFQVDFPESGTLTIEQCRALRSALPSKAAPKLSKADLDECEETILRDVDMAEESRRRQQQRRTEAYHEDEDEDDMGGQRVQCSQQ
ncbi:hypothetical protein KP509_21G088900 [Ceratopteris richardii]|nr:hypothetical protein KP509_21G088900 [Ceratopteris richardii]